MEIQDTRTVTPDRYEITDVQARCDWFDGTRQHVIPYVTVWVEPENYMRNRFSGSSYEKKKHGARSIKLYQNEIQQIIQAMQERTI